MQAPLLRFSSHDRAQDFPAILFDIRRRDCAVSPRRNDRRLRTIRVDVSSPIFSTAVAEDKPSAISFPLIGLKADDAHRVSGRGVARVGGMPWHPISLDRVDDLT